MIAARRLRSLRSTDIRLLAGVCLVQLALAAALRIMPLPALRRAVGRGRAMGRLAANAPDDRVAWAIEAVGRRLPRISTCFVRALAADLLLSGGGAIRIGVRRTPQGSLESHAWFERDGQAVVGGSGAAEFVAFLTLPSASLR